MTAVPANPKIYHITHLDNLASIAASGQLVSDAIRLAQSMNCSVVGMAEIKHRRIEEMEVSICPGTKVGQYVPFYFCPRSIMLYILHMGNHPELTYRGGQQPIVHLVRDPRIKEGKQAEFLTFGTFPWTLVEKIGTINDTIADRVRAAIAGNPHQPVIQVERNWYF